MTPPSPTNCSIWAWTASSPTTPPSSGEPSPCGKPSPSSPNASRRQGAQSPACRQIGHLPLSRYAPIPEPEPSSLPTTSRPPSSPLQAYYWPTSSQLTGRQPVRCGSDPHRSGCLLVGYLLARPRLAPGLSQAGSGPVRHCLVADATPQAGQGRRRGRRGCRPGVGLLGRTKLPQGSHGQAAAAQCVTP